MDVNAKSALTGNSLIGSRVSYLFVCASGYVSNRPFVSLSANNSISPLGWAPFIADSLVYHPPSSNRFGVFAATFIGFVASKTFVEFIGIGL
jgi:purine-cytosine permease-like protein